ncbi:diguanylate cyclase domain-containing protein [Pokkaliibacter sp. CJK22405]|uniref:diguanylate cyclase domain-containing protein n=1 Tax=Pokkaliibacter sp. CJK22405 TaxID=3384615 RepID=UPI003984DCFA
MDSFIAQLNALLTDLYHPVSLPGWMLATLLVLVAASLILMAMYVRHNHGLIKDANQELLMANRRLSLATSVAGVGIWEWEKETDTLLWNPVMFRLYGVQPGEPMSIERMRAWILPDDWQQFKSLLGNMESTDRHEITFAIIRESDGSLRYIHAACYWLYTGRKHRLLGTQMDITEEHAAREKVYREAYQDALTLLPNSRALKSQLRLGLEQTAPGRMQGLFFIDLDGFKKVNDTLGHDIGDLLLKGAAGRMRQIIRQQDRVYRLGGDEFVVWIADVPDQDIHVLETIANKLIDTLSKPFQFDEVRAQVSASIGIARYPQQSSDMESLLKAADEAMYLAKRGGKNAFAHYSTPASAASGSPAADAVPE